MAKIKQELIYGTHAVQHALKHSAAEVLELWVQQGKKQSAELLRILELANKSAVPVQMVSRDTLTKHSGDARHQGVVLKRKASGTNSRLTVDEIIAAADGNLLLLVLDGLQDPHNLGACLRTADAAGADAVIIPKDRSVPVNATVRKVASGAVENTPVITETNIARCLRRLQEAGIWVVGTDDQSAQTLYEVDLNRPLAIVMGSEGKGLRHNTRKQCDYLVALPMAGVVESLNVSVASGICLFEALRQRKTV